MNRKRSSRGLKRVKATFSDREIEHLAGLARIELTSRERAMVRSQLNEIVEYFRMIDKVETEGVPPTYHIQDTVNVLREDEPELFESDKILGAAPQRKDRYIRAPKMM